MSEYPKEGGGGWWELSDGSKVQGERVARIKESALAGEEEGEFIAVNQWRDRDKYTCLVCNRFQSLDNPEPVIDHILTAHN